MAEAKTFEQVISHPAGCLRGSFSTYEGTRNRGASARGPLPGRARDNRNTIRLPTRRVEPVIPPVRDTRRTSKLISRRLAFVALLASLIFLVAACGGGPAQNGVASLGHGTTKTTAQSSSPAAQGTVSGGQPPSGGGGGANSPGGGVSATFAIGGSYTQDVRFAECLRSHGFPDFPGPSSNGTFHISSSSGAVPGSPEFQAALNACRKFMPNGGAVPSPAQQAKMLAQALQYSVCMRSHGITDFPDPQSTNGRVGFSIKAGPGSDLDPNDPQFQAAQKACQKFLPGPP